VICSDEKSGPLSVIAATIAGLQVPLGPSGLSMGRTLKKFFTRYNKNFFALRLCVSPFD
jgi:hypothetical protein